MTFARSPELKERMKTIFRLCLWFILSLALFEGIVAYLFTSPVHKPNQVPGALTQYFEYGRSCEGKLKRMQQQASEDSHPIVSAAWLHPIPQETAAERVEHAGKKQIAVYGMSFAHHIVDAFVETDNTYYSVGHSGPGAPPNYTYAAFEAHFPTSGAEIAVWAILASSIPEMLGFTHQTSGFEQPAPFTYPRFDVVAGELTRTEPLVRTHTDFQSALADIDKVDGPDNRWSAWRKQLTESDGLYSALLFDEGWSDNLATIRLARRGWARRAHQEWKDAVYNSNGFRADALPARTLPELARRFKKETEATGALPVVLLVHDQGMSTHLFQLLKPVLTSEKIPYLSTHELVNPDDPRAFQADGHINHEGNVQLGNAFGKLLHAHGF